MKTAAIVLSAGSGKRMNSDQPKQYIQLCGHPVIYYSLKAFQESIADEVILVTRPEDLDYCGELVRKYGFSKVKEIVPGGQERYDSVYEGLKALDPADTGAVLIHDGARPLVTTDMIRRSLRAAMDKNACAIAVPAKDTIKLADSRNFALETPDRSRLWQIQTPQAFSYDTIRSAYDLLYLHIHEGLAVPKITDDAMVAEYAGNCKVYLEMGSYENIKITTPEDLEIAEIFLRKRREA